MKSEFSYDIFDRQLDALLSMGCIVVDTWDDCDTLEMLLNIKSLCLKASRLCLMADEDWNRQQNGFYFSRIADNKKMLKALEILVTAKAMPLISNVLNEVRVNRTIKTRVWAEQNTDPLAMLPKLSEFIVDDEVNEAEWDELMTKVAELSVFIRPSVPQLADAEINPVLCIILLLEFFSNLCYLCYHFRRTTALCQKEVPEEESGIYMQRLIHYYSNSEEGKNELKRFKAALLFDNDNMLSISLLEEQRKALRKEVPEVFQLCFMENHGDLAAIGREFNSISCGIDERLTFIAVLAKWQMLTMDIENIKHPERIEPEIENGVFCTMLHDSHIDMKELREKIASMVQHVSKKNHWFCVWSVLKYRNLLCTDNFKAFATQMMLPDWFGNMPEHLHFSTDTLSEYSGYFTENLFTCWNNDDYEIYKKRYGKNKWGKSLCSNFKNLCERMNAEF